MPGDVVMFLHCKQCISDPMRDALQQSPAEFARLEVGVTREGDLSVRCTRHDASVARFRNADVAHELLYLAGKPCGAHGHDH